MNSNINTKIDNYEKIYSQIQGNEDILNKEVVGEIKEFSRGIRRKIEDAIETDRLLRIGIVGEVKAGKSTFLNALVFDGKQILPQAATPMTAALTKIVYSEHLKAEIEFYDRADWDTIEAYAKEYEEQYEELRNEFIQIKQSQQTNPFSNVINKQDSSDKRKIKIDRLELESYINGKISSQSKGCHELVQMLYERNIDFEECIKRGIDIIDNINNVDDLMGRLENYVGSEGEYTPIVKSTRIYLNFESLKGLEIIDTPGTNDPIVSRSMATRKYLGNCDVVFLLSYAGQFMKSQDVQFLSQTLPNEGIQTGIIVGSKFDSALLDDNNSGYDFIKSLRITTDKLNRHAKDIMDREVENDPTNKTLNSIKESLPPIYVSPMAYIISKKERSELCENELHIIKRLEQRFSNFNFTNDVLRQLSSIDRIHNEKLQAVRNKKDVILKEKLENTIYGQAKKARSLINELEKDISIKLDNLINSDKKHLDENLEKLRKQSNKIEDRIINIFENESIEIRRLIKKLQLDIKSKYKDYDVLKVETKTSTSTHTSRGGFLWTKKTTTTTTTTTYESKVKSVVDNIRSYALDIEKCALKDFEFIIDIRKIKSKLKESIVEELDLKNQGIDEEQILYSIDTVLKKLTIQELALDIDKYERIIGNAFSGSIVKNDDIHKLESKQRDTLVRISTDVGNELDKIATNIGREFDDYSRSFIAKVIGNLEENINQIKEQLDNKEQYKIRYENLISELRNIKMSI